MFQPQNLSLAQSTKFKLSFSKLPYVTYFCSSVNIPGVSMTPTQQATPFSDLPVPGDKIQYETFDVSFLIDEDYRSWFTIHDWIRGVTFPTSYEEYRNLKLNNTTYPQNRTMVLSTETPQYSDAILTIYTNKNNPNLRIKFKDCFPISLSSVRLSAQESADVILNGDVSFKFAYYDIERV